MYNLIRKNFDEKNYDQANKIAFEIYNKDKENDRICKIIGEIYLKKKNFELSEKFFKKAIKLNPIQDNFFSIGNFYLQTEKFKKAIKFYEKIKIDKKTNNIILNNLSFCYFNTFNFEKSIKLLNFALDKEKDNHFIIYNLANIYKEIDELSKAETLYNKALKFDPKNQNYLFNKSLVLLKKKNYKKAWPLYDTRIELRNKNNKIFNLIKDKIYNKQFLPENNKFKFCIIPEQGVGDQLLFSSMYPDIIKRYPNTFIFTDKRLQDTFKNTYKFKNFIDLKDIRKIKELLNNNYQFLYAASLGKFCRNEHKDFLNTTKLNVNLKIKNNIIKRLKKYKGKKLIGISWYSESKSLKSKSLKIDFFSDLLKKENCVFINLQYGNAAKEISKLSLYKNKIIDFSDIDIYNDFDSLIALIDCLDLVITIDNINLQIAGLLEKMTYVITPFNNEYILYSKSNEGVCDWYHNTKIFYLDIFKKNTKSIFNQIIKRI